MVQLAASFVVLCSLAVAGFSTPVKRTVAQIQVDITDVSAKAATLSDVVNKYPFSGGTLVAALTIHRGAEDLDTAIKKATSDIRANGQIDASEASKLFSSVQALENPVHVVLDAIKTKELALSALPVGNVIKLVLQDLIVLDVDTIALSNTLISNTPDTLTAAWEGLRDDIHNTFTSAIDDYSN